MTDEKDLGQAGETPEVDPSVGAAGTAAPPDAEPAAEAPDLTAASDAAVAVEEAQPAEGEVPPTEDKSPDGDVDDKMLAMLEELPEEESATGPDDVDFSQASVSKAEFQHLSEPASNSDSRNIDLLMDVNLPISIELGRTKMPISDILALGPGSVVELNKLAGEPVDLLVNYKIVAKGEVVVVDENFGVRIVQLVTPEERLRILGEE
jgi:flagellar motor switch protein FliN/FliY